MLSCAPYELHLPTPLIEDHLCGRGHGARESEDPEIIVQENLNFSCILHHCCNNLLSLFV